jgi:DNA-directed RNA polymerase subunit RPC12/RpoP
VRERRQRGFAFHFVERHPAGLILKYSFRVAKLVPATCPKCGGNVHLDPAQEFVTCQYCGASSFVQTQKRPVTQYVHAQAMPVIHVPHAVGLLSGCSGAIAVIAGLLGVGGAIAGIAAAYFATSAATAVTAPFVPSPAATPTSGADTTSDAPSGPLVEEDYFADATLMKARYAKVLGKPIMAKQLVLMQYYATLEAQDPKNHEHVDSYKLWANKVERPQPVRLSGSDKQQLQQALFSLDNVDFRLVSTLIKRALADLKLEEGKVSNVILERDGSSPGHEPIWRVYVMGSRDNGFVEFSVTGEKKRSAQ